MREKPAAQTFRNQKHIKMKETKKSELQEFRKHLVDERNPSEPRSNPELGHRDTSSSSHELPMETRAKGERCSDKHLCLHALYEGSKLPYLPEDENNEGPVQKTHRRSRTSCRKFDDLITADHKVLSDNCESRNNHRCAVVVQDLATQWLPSYTCKTKTSQETQKSLMKFQEPTRKRKVIFSDKSLEFRTLLKSRPDKEWWADSMECYCYLPNIQDLLSDGKTPCGRRFGIPFNGLVIPFGAMVKYHRISAKDQSPLHLFGVRVLPGFCLGYIKATICHKHRRGLHVDVKTMPTFIDVHMPVHQGHQRLT